MKIVGTLSVLALAVCTVGCESFSGGGWIDSFAGPAAKANFGFTVACTNDGSGGSLANGTVEYQDKGVLVALGKAKASALRFHGTIPQIPLGATCEQLDALQAIFLGSDNIYWGTYETQPPVPGSGGIFAVQVKDNGKAGPNNQDTFSIWVGSGAYAGYQNTGILQGGNITLQP